MATRLDPFDEMDRLLGQMFTSERAFVAMPMDLYRVVDHYVLKVDLPGADPDSIDVSIKDRTLTIRAERVQAPDAPQQWLTRERSVGAYARQLTVGRGLSLDNITAVYTDGVLTLTIPVAEEAKPRKISVTRGIPDDLQIVMDETVEAEIAQAEAAQADEADEAPVVAEAEAVEGDVAEVPVGEEVAGEEVAGEEVAAEVEVAEEAPAEIVTADAEAVPVEAEAVEAEAVAEAPAEAAEAVAEDVPEAAEAAQEAAAPEVEAVAEAPVEAVAVAEGGIENTNPES